VVEKGLRNSPDTYHPFGDPVPHILERAGTFASPLDKEDVRRINVDYFQRLDTISNVHFQKTF
jgi:hypothetical protein